MDLLFTVLCSLNSCLPESITVNPLGSIEIHTTAKNWGIGISLVFQWLRIRIPCVEGPDSIPGQRTRFKFQTKFLMLPNKKKNTPKLGHRLKFYFGAITFNTVNVKMQEHGSYD